uniref:Uncharacterized protein n=1 Tax=Panagrolaimus superbus TaxID=310955 RepID=A0A914Z425_9BILA
MEQSSKKTRPIATLEYRRDYYARTKDRKQAYLNTPEYKARKAYTQRMRRAGTPVPRPTLSETKCTACGKHGHNRSNSLLCILHPSYIPIA